jgi:hypothetical protein
MDTNQSGTQPRRYFRFSLGMLMALVACICCYLAGDLRGNRDQFFANKAAANAVATTSDAYPKTYYVDDLVISPDSGNANYDPLMVTIVETCSPDQWEQAGGPGRISPFPLNQSLIISATVPMHKQIATLLAALRKEKFGPDYQYTRGVAAQAARDKTPHAN